LPAYQDHKAGKDFMKLLLLALVPGILSFQLFSLAPTRLRAKMPPTIALQKAIYAFAYYVNKNIHICEYFMPPRQDTEICRRIAQLRLETAGPRGKASFAKKLGISPSTYDYYESTRVPPAEVLVKIAECTGVDLYWLLTGKTKAGIDVAAGHPLVQRVARLLADSPKAAGPLAVFLEILSGVQKFPAGQVPQAIFPEVPTAAPKAASKTKEQPPPAEGQPAKETWIPILGRTAAGVAHFWSRAEEAAGLTTLDELVDRYCRAPHRSVQPAAAAEQGSADQTAVQVITLPGGAKSPVVEFIAAEALKRRYGDAFALRIDGDSMAPDIRHGDLVILSPSAPAVDGRPAVVQLTGQIGVICKLYRRVGDRVHLIPIDEQLVPQVFPVSKVRWALAVLARVRV
jgi:SOS-response transcriptional repressor LexA